MQYEEYLKYLGLNIKFYRMRKGLTQATIAERLGVDEPYVSQIENGHRNITAKTIFNLANAIEVDSYKFFEFRD